MHIKTEKPQGFSYIPGQAVDVAIDHINWKNELRAFTFTSLPSDDYLEFFIKIYPEHHGVTEQIGKLHKNDTLLIGEVFGDIQYKEQGIFIAGGAGITPFIAILKELKNKDKAKNNTLIFANKTVDDIIEYQFFSDLLGKNFVNVISEEKNKNFAHGYITKDLIKSHIENQHTNFYLCGPQPMMDAVLKQLDTLGIEASKIIKEQF